MVEALPIGNQPIDRLPELHSKLNDMVKEKLGPRALEVLHLNVLLLKCRKERIDDLLKKLAAKDVSEEEVDELIERYHQLDRNFRDYDGGLLELDMEEYIKMRHNATLQSHLEKLRKRLVLDLQLAKARQKRDTKPLIT